MAQPFADEEDLDATISVFEEPMDPIFPRRPNVVSHRRHMLNLEVTLHRVPEGTTTVSISADVIALGPERIGQQEHLSRSMRIWGSTPPVPFELVDLPVTYSIPVSRLLGNDHLGQGPYDAFVTVSPSDELRTAEAEGGVPIITNRTFAIRFASM